MKKTWEELRNIKTGTILHDEFKDGLRFMVMRGPLHLCAYIGVPIGHPLAGHDYDDLPVNCHGGLTFARQGDKEEGTWPEGFYWYGWDYGHCNDYAFYYDEIPFSRIESTGKKWLVKDVIQDSWDALNDFSKLLKLSEKIKKS